MSSMSARVDILYVSEVIDGDTLRRGKEYYRLARVNAPEKGKPNRLSAKKYLASLIEGKTVAVEEYAIDIYGRRIVEVKFDGKNVNDQMITHITSL